MTTTTETPVDNGVNVEALLGARDALRRRPGDRPVPVAVHGVGSTARTAAPTSRRSTASARSSGTATFSYDVDHPLQFAAQDNGVTPVEYVLVALGGCLTAGIAAVAQQRPSSCAR